jgi:hypothetical protein
MCENFATVNDVVMHNMQDMQKYAKGYEGLTTLKGNAYYENQKIGKNEFWYLKEILDKWGVYSSGSVIKKFGGKNCYEAMITTKSVNPRNKGAFFLTVIRRMNGIATSTSSKDVEVVF